MRNEFYLDSSKKGCFNSSSAVALYLGSIYKHLDRKSLASEDYNYYGIEGGYVDLPIFTITAIASLYSEYGGYPVAISIIVQPRLQISAFFPYCS